MPQIEGTVGAPWDPAKQQNYSAPLSNAVLSLCNLIVVNFFISSKGFYMTAPQFSNYIRYYVLCLRICITLSFKPYL
jgi:hypothetical protein